MIEHSHVKMCNFLLLQSEKLLLYDTVQSELEEKIRRLEEDRHSIDITSGGWKFRVAGVSVGCLVGGVFFWLDCFGFFNLLLATDEL